MNSVLKQLDQTLQPLDNINNWIQQNSSVISNVDEAVDLLNPSVLTPKVVFVVLLLCLSTGVGAWGGFDSAPKVFKKLTRYGWFRFLLLFLMIWQGGGGLNIFVTLFGTTAFYLLDYLLNRYETEVLQFLGMDDEDDE